MAIEDLGTYLREIQAEPSFRKWCESLGSLEQAWNQCDRADWMLHLLENCGHPSPLGLRRFCRELFDRFSDHLPDAVRGSILTAMEDGWENLDQQGRPINPELATGARATVAAAAGLSQAVGNWTPARVMLIAEAALHDDPMAAARGTSEQAGMAAQYTHPFPTASDWPEEMAAQADSLRSILGNPFAGV